MTFVFKHEIKSNDVLTENLYIYVYHNVYAIKIHPKLLQ